MTSFMQRSAQHFLIIKAARQVRQEVEKAGLDNLKILADAGKSIIFTYFNGCSSQEKARIRRDFNALQQMGITPEMVLDEVARQNPELASIMESKQEYKKTEIRNLEAVLKEH